MTGVFRVPGSPTSLVHMFGLTYQSPVRLSLSVNRWSKTPAQAVSAPIAQAARSAPVVSDR